MADLHTYRKLPSDPCLTQEQITAYIDGDLSSAEMHACETHMLDCEMCEDAVEGLSLVKDRSVLAAPLKTAETPTEGKVIPLQRPNRRVWYAAAAVLALVLATTFTLRMLSTGGDTAMAENTSAAPDSIQQTPGTGYATENQKQSSADSLTPTRSELKPAPMKTAQGQTFAEATGLDDAPEAITEYDRYPMQEEIVMEQVAPPALANDDLADGDFSPGRKENVEDEKTVDAKTIQEKQNKKPLLDYAKDALTSGGVATQDKKDAYVDDNRSTEAPKATANAPASNNAQTFTLGNSNGTDTSTKYGAVSSETTSVVRADSVMVDQLELSYRNGVAQLNAGQVNSAIALFDKVLADKNHARYQDAEFQKAKALIKANRKEEAKTLLKAIEAKKGKHAAEATELLKTL